jgi:hypothetical protein
LWMLQGILHGAQACSTAGPETLSPQPIVECFAIERKLGRVRQFFAL